MLQTTHPTRIPRFDRKAATLAVLLLAVGVMTCRAGVAVYPGDMLVEEDGTMIDSVYEVVRGYPQRYPGRSIESYPPKRQDLVFVIDASGSMVRLLPFVINETKRVINELRPSVFVTIICFSGRGIYEVDSAVGWSGLRQSTPAFKAEARDWLSLSNHCFKTGGSGVRFAEAAIVRSLRYKPDLIFILSDHLGGGGPGAGRHEIDQEALLAAIHAENDVQTPAKINTISFVNSGPLAEAGLRGTLERIADETGGRFKYIGERDLDLR